ncbi:hypothetical protein [Gilvimarinus sp. 1_MG-2023]|uniref:hypothetical protein n=1 Tax=Gilvimarinus sp. 1_MG-2023 TaxID=3062638 RepID=UPI0026E12B84|nr:hypothetical protein [Gilvimarinus sp. 1_MG-2023]MDO6747172.1 hypothetical protein [Gilvimarinus sp. 1_MG-2023]
MQPVEKRIEELTPGTSAGGDLTTSNSTFELTPRSLEEAMKFADLLAGSSIVPKDFQRNPGNILVAIQWGAELGIKPMQAMQNIAVINGRPSLWGDAVIALVRSSPLCEYIYETEEDGVAICRVKRVGEEEQVRTFSDEDAKAAGLLNKQGPWTQYKKRMKQMRARGFAVRDVFPDVLKGMAIVEEEQDKPKERDITPKQEAAGAEKVKPVSRTSSLKNKVKSSKQKTAEPEAAGPSEAELFNRISADIDKAKDEQQLAKASADVEKLGEEYMAKARFAYKYRLLEIRDMPVSIEEHDGVPHIINTETGDIIQ